MDNIDAPSRPSPAKVVRIPDFYYDEQGQGVAYELQDKEGNMLSQLGGTEINPEYNRYGKHVENTSPMLVSLRGNTPKEHQRRGYYQQLLNTILHNNMNILSTSRNYNSQPFHESFQRRLPPSIDFSDVNPELQRHLPSHLRDKHSQKYLYQFNPIKQSKRERSIKQRVGVIYNLIMVYCQWLMNLKMKDLQI